MSDKVKEEIKNWKTELQLEKNKNVEEVNEAAEKVQIAKAKYYVAEKSLDSMNKDEEREKFYEINVKPLEEALDIAERQFENMKLAKGMRNAHIDLLLAQIDVQLTQVK